MTAPPRGPTGRSLATRTVPFQVKAAGTPRPAPARPPATPQERQVRGSQRPAQGPGPPQRSRPGPPPGEAAVTWQRCQAGERPPTPGTTVHCQCLARVGASSFQGLSRARAAGGIRPRSPRPRPPRHTFDSQECVALSFLEGENSPSAEFSPGPQLLATGQGSWEGHGLRDPHPAFPRPTSAL